MSYENLIMILCGGVSLSLGLWQFSVIYNDTKNGYRSEFGYDIQLYLASIAGIMLGCILIYKAIF